MEEILHLYITEPCGHNCPLCCNKLYKLDEIPVVTVELLKSVDTVCLTGGDPFMLDIATLGKFIINLRSQYPNIDNLYIYTSGKDFGEKIEDVLVYINSHKRSVSIDGINIAPKDIYDWIGLIKGLDESYMWFGSREKSNRLYVFKEQRPIFDALNIKLPLSFAVIDRKWATTFNTPSNEHFARLPILL